MRKDGIQTRKRKPKKPSGRGSGDRDETSSASTDGSYPIIFGIHLMSAVGVTIGVS